MNADATILSYLNSARECQQSVIYLRNVSCHGMCIVLNTLESTLWTWNGTKGFLLTRWKAHVFVLRLRQRETYLRGVTY